MNDTATTIRNYARCADGTRIFFRIDEAGKAAPHLVLIHSLAMDHTFWLPVARRLSGFASVLTYDCRGHGRSDKPGGPYTSELFANDLADLMDHVGWPSSAIAGASMGGCVSLAFGASFPNRTRALGLIDTTAWYGPDAPSQWEARAEKALAEGLEGLVEFQLTRWFGEQFRRQHPDVVRHCLNVFLNNNVRAYAETCRMLGAHNLTAALPKLTCPTAVIVGEEDYATPVAMARTMHEGIRSSRLVVVEKARHLTPLEAPDRIAAELRTLLKDSQ